MIGKVVAFRAEGLPPADLFLELLIGPAEFGVFLDQFPGEAPILRWVWTRMRTSSL